MAEPGSRAASRDLSVPQTVSDAESFEEFFAPESGTLFRRLCLVTGIGCERWTTPSGYLYRTAFNVFRKRVRRAHLALRKTLRITPGRDEFAAVDATDAVARALATLTPRQRAALVLTELLGYSSDTAGSILGVKAVTVRALASQGRAALRTTMEPTDA